METIKNYLESMFANMPRTPEVQRAKNELLQMMEDKYNELIAEGKSENEAVGTVISEFGNLDELADILGLQQEVKEERELVESYPRRMLILDEVKDYLQFCGIRAGAIALGVALCILSITAPILFDAIKLPSVGVAVMFLMIISAVALFVIMGVNGKRWEYLKKEPCSIDFATSNYIMNEKERYRYSYTSQLTIGIILCATCWLPAVIMEDVKRLSGISENLVAVLLLLMIAVGVFLIVHTSMIMGSYNEMLKLNDRDTMSGGYSKNVMPEYRSSMVEKLMSVYWPTVRSLYLIWSFLTFAWWRTWIIWPVAGILFGILKSVLKTQAKEA